MRSAEDSETGERDYLHITSDQSNRRVERPEVPLDYYNKDLSKNHLLKIILILFSSYSLYAN
ncbi:MAG: hypothetical protein MJ252_05090 [archaeon]|nr:hypothetical protein [archaeon]